MHHPLPIIRCFRFQRLATQSHSQLLQIHPLKSGQHVRLNQLRVVRIQKIKSPVMQHFPLRSLKPDEAPQQRLCTLRHKLQFPPQLIQLGRFRIGQNTPDQWLIVPEKSFDQMKTSRQPTSTVHVEKTIGKDSTKLLPKPRQLRECLAVR